MISPVILIHQNQLYFRFLSLFVYLFDKRIYILLIQCNIRNLSINMCVCMCVCVCVCVCVC